MKPEFENYLTGLGMGKVLRERVETLESQLRQIFTEELPYIFVSEYVRQDGSREYESLFFVSLIYVVEFKEFESKSHFDIDVIREDIINVRMDSEEFDFVTANKKSRLNVIYAAPGISAIFKASSENCTRLVEILRKCLLPNLGK